MAKEISDFEWWLQMVTCAIRGKDLRHALDFITDQARETYGAAIWFVKIMGRRWSFMTGTINTVPAPDDIARVPLADGIGLVSDNWGALVGKERDIFIRFLRSLIELHNLGKNTAAISNASDTASEAIG